MLLWPMLPQLFTDGSTTSMYSSYDKRGRQGGGVCLSVSVRYTCVTGRTSGANEQHGGANDEQCPETREPN